MKSSTGLPGVSHRAVGFPSASREVHRARSAQVRGLTRVIEWVGLTAVAAALILAAVSSLHPDAPDAVQTRPIRIAGGDSLWSLARAHPVDGLRTEETVDLIRRLNDLHTPVIQPGQRLLVPADVKAHPSMASR